MLRSGSVRQESADRYIGEHTRRYTTIALSEPGTRKPTFIIGSNLHFRPHLFGFGRRNFGGFRARV